MNSLVDNITVAPLGAAPSTTDLAGLATLLRDAVEGGASVGYMLPLKDAEVAAFWNGVLADVAAQRRVLLVARAGGTIAGAVQLELATRPNSTHRAEVQKLLVLRAHRGRGIGTRLMAAIESAAAARGRTLLVLDTSASGNALNLYSRCGYIRAGEIPRYARDPDGPLITTVIFYKDLAAAPPAAARP